MTENTSVSPSSEDYGKFILRFTIGFLMLFHGVAKFGHTGFIESSFEGMGLPSFLAYGVYLGEIVAPIMLILGVKIRIASLLIIATMIVAILMAHSGDIFKVTPYGAWAIEIQMFYILSSLSVILIGNDKLCFDSRRKNKA